MNLRGDQFSHNIYFITFNIYQKFPLFKQNLVKNLFIQVLIETRNKYGYSLYG